MESCPANGNAGPKTDPGKRKETVKGELTGRGCKNYATDRPEPATRPKGVQVKEML